MNPVNIGNRLGTTIGNNLSFGFFIRNIISAAIIISGIVALFLFLMGGFKIIQGAGNNDPRATSQGKEAVTWALIGFIIIFIAYWIIRIIEIITGVNFVTVNPTLINP